MALRRVGTDFELMHQIMPQYSRDQLKRKFKREEKVRSLPALVQYLARDFIFKLFEFYIVLSRVLVSLSGISLGSALRYPTINC